MIEIALAAAVLVAGYLVLSFFFYRWRFPPLFNIVLAKATFDSLPADRQREVSQRALQIVNRRWRSGRGDCFEEGNFHDEPHRLSWYALSMAELGIPPLANRLASKWHYVKRPNWYPLKEGSIYRDIVYRLNRESGIQVSVVFPLPRSASGPALKPGGATALDAFNAVVEPLLVSSYRAIAEKRGRAPSAKTSDADIVRIYRRVGTAFRDVSKERGEHLPAGHLNRRASR